MYALEIRDHIMIAHSLKDPFFGPAQNKHGATFIVDVAFFAEELGDHQVVVDIGRASDALSEALKTLNYADLDERSDLSDTFTTTEFLCRHIFDLMVKAHKDGALGPGSERVGKIRVTLEESHIARAWFEGPVAT
ncbi:MAG: 6-carboxytetrahydropterin synthase [Pseudomonadota bacterium]